MVFITCQCSNVQEGNKDKLLAKVGSRNLFAPELKGLIKPGLSKEDSLAMVVSLAEKWVRKQLILQKAELNLNDNEKDVNKELDEYRTSLLIFKYEQKLIKEKLDTVVSAKEINQYYNENPSNFILNNDVVKAQYIKLPIRSQNIDKVREWLRSGKAENIKLLESYCIQNEIKYEYFKDDWVNFENIKMLLPTTIPNNEQFLRSYKFVELRDSLNFHFLNILEFKLKGTVSPLKLVEDDITSIILLKRKQKLINDLENKIYFDAMDHNYFNIYKK